MAKAWDVVGLDRDLPLARCARLIVDTRFREMMSYMEGTLLGEDIEQLHSMRVGSRRLRSAMRNFRECFEPSGFRAHEARIKEIADALGAVRDLDVRIEWLQGVLAVTKRLDRPGIRFLLDRAEADREHARGPMAELLERLDRDNYAAEFLGFIWEEVAAHG